MIKLQTKHFNVAQNTTENIKTTPCNTNSPDRQLYMLDYAHQSNCCCRCLLM